MARTSRSGNGRGARRAGGLVAVGVLAVAGLVGVDQSPAVGMGTPTTTSPTPPGASTTSFTSAPSTSVDLPANRKSPPRQGEVPPASPTASSPKIADEQTIAETLGLVFSLSTGGVNLPLPDPDCFADALADLSPASRSVLHELVEDPFTWNQIPGDDALPLSQAYVGCAGDDELLTMLTFGLLGIPDVACLRLAWDARISTGIVASSLAFGDGFSDLPPDLVDQLTSRAIECWSDRVWWIDEIALDLLDETDFSAETAQCVAGAYVDVIGIDRAVALQILTLPLLSLSTDERQRLDLENRCGAKLPPVVADVPVGGCLRDFGTGVLAATDCAGSHNAEVVGLHDLNARHPLWPGMRTIRTSTLELCSVDVAAVGGGPAGYVPGWDTPTREQWERGRRTLICVLVRPNYEAWTGPSGLLPPAGPSTSTIVAGGPAPTTATSGAPSTTVPPGAVELLDVSQITEIGTCVYRAPALPGQLDADRRFFRVACSMPHQAELYHRFDIAGAADVPYPGDAIVQEQADAACMYVFGTYVGEAWATSRFGYWYFYPSAETWAERDRSVQCFLTGSSPEEMFTRSMAGSGE